MATHIEKALEFIRKRIDEQEFNYMVCSAMRERASFSSMYPREADEIADALEEYGQDNDLPEGWWCEECDIDEIIERI